MRMPCVAQFLYSFLVCRVGDGESSGEGSRFVR